MKLAQRLVGLPMPELWDDRDTVPASRSRDLTAEDVRAALRLGPLRFVVADCGKRPEWIPESDCFTFWKTEVHHHLALADGAPLDDLPGGYLYIASEWVPEMGSPIVLLEKHH